MKIKSNRLKNWKNMKLKINFNFINNLNIKYQLK